ncbi:MAG: pantoate--beta-alanine ligase [Desulfobulbaceae bacterium]|nr:MAG: pantoate--beta-alanine ligase [Desulfobulbaceae bacterium]
MVTSIAEARVAISRWRGDGCSIGLVPTMGYFHDGHLELMRASVRQTDKTVVSLFVNPTQFGPEEDLEVYPRDLEGDCAKASQVGVDLVFRPQPNEIYRPGHQTEVSLAGLASGLCADDRPGHFTGVATVVAKLFNIVLPDFAFFGEKDFQQLRIIRQLTEDLNFTIGIVGVPIVREADGLAMSSRNYYLSESERSEVLVLYRALHHIRHKVLEEQVAKADELINQGAVMIKKCVFCTLEYLSIVDEKSLQAVSDIEGKCRVLGAIRVNQRIRLIDNMALYR